jgi:polyketide cyclase/dehydrase/lipid transport protein
MKWLLIGLGVIALVSAAITAIGAALPRGHSATRQAALPVPPDVVWRTITDVDAFPSWRSGVKSVTRLPDRDGRPRWVEETNQGKIPLAVERSEPPRLLVVRIDDPDLPFGGTWTYSITPTTAGSRLSITEDGEVYNPIFRFMARFVFGYEATMRAYVDALSKKLAS